MLLVACNSESLFEKLIQSCFMQLQVLFKSLSNLTDAEEETRLCLCVYVCPAVSGDEEDGAQCCSPCLMSGKPG